MQGMWQMLKKAKREESSYHLPDDVLIINPDKTSNVDFFKLARTEEGSRKFSELAKKLNTKNKYKIEIIP